MKKQVIVSISFLLFVTFFIGCAGINNFDKEVNQAVDIKKSGDALMDQGPVRGGTIHLFGTYPDTLNPLLTENIYVKEMLENVHEGLVQLDTKLNLIPCLAESWSVSKDYLTWTFTLRKNVFWHDHIPFSAEDVEFTMDMLLKNANPSTYKKNLENISTYMALDKYTFRVVLKTPNSFTPELMTFPIMAKHVFVNENFSISSKNMKPIGTGPYKFVSYTEKKDIKFIMNDKWWNQKNSQPNLPNLPYIAELNYKLYAIGKDAVNAFQAGEIDVATMSTIDAAKYKGRVDLMLKRFPSRNFDFLSFNSSKSALADKNVRQAIAYAVDRYRIINNFMPGQATISEIPVLPSTWINDRSRNFYELNKEKSKEILIKTGWKQSQNTMVKYFEGNYSTLTFELLVNQENDLRVITAQNIAEQLNEVGFNVQIKKVDYDNYIKLLQNKQFDLAIGGCYVPQAPDLSFMYASFNNKAKGNQMFNVSGYSNQQVDLILNNILLTKGSIQDGFKLKNLYNELEKNILEEVPYLGLFFYNETILYNKRIRGEFKPFIYNRFYDLNRWYLP